MTARHAAPKRRKREYEDDAFAKATGRFITAMERRASTNPDGLAYLLTLRKEMDDAVMRAGHQLHVNAGFSLGEIAEFMTFNGHKMSRQAAQQRWGRSSIARKLGMPRIAEQLNNVVRLADFRERRAAAAASADEQHAQAARAV